jgi:hypothetical protein
MADNERTFSPSEAEVNRGRMQGLGVGQKEMDAQRDPNREQHATDPQRTEPFDNDPAGTGDDRGQASSDMGAGAVSQGGANASGAAMEDRSFDQDAAPGEGLDDRNAAGLQSAGDLGAGTPANVDIHDVGQSDNPEEEWGEPADEGTIHSSNHTRRGEKTEAERGQGAKTRQMNKDIISRRT